MKYLPITAIKAPSWIVLFRPIRSAVCPAIRAPTGYQRSHIISRTESSSGKNRHDRSSDTGVGVLEVGMELVIAVRDDGSDNSRVVSEQKRTNGTDIVSCGRLHVFMTHAKMAAT